MVKIWLTIFSLIVAAVAVLKLKFSLVQLEKDISIKTSWIREILQLIYEKSWLINLS